MDFKGISTVRNTLGWEEICLFLWLKNSFLLYFIIVTCFHFRILHIRRKYVLDSIEKKFSINIEGQNLLLIF